MIGAQPRERKPLPSARDGRRRWLLYLLLAALGLLIPGAIGTAAFFARPAPLPVPPAVADLPLHAHQFGAEAARSLVRLHRRRFPVTGAAMAMYGTAEATLWVARSWSGWGAARMTGRMTRAIAEGDSPFTPQGEQPIDGVTVYALTGMGQRHYYFRVDDRIYWLAVVPERADQALQEILAFARDEGAGTAARP